MNPAEKEILTGRIRSFLETELPEIVAAYLFGSFTEKRSFSDIDIGILLRKTPEKPMEVEFKLENDLERILNLPVDLRILNKAPLSFCYTVIRQKEIIVDRDSDLRADFETYTLKKYFDFAPFRRRYLAEVENAEI
jgi:predicted nucleotidyltransferase